MGNVKTDGADFSTVAQPSGSFDRFSEASRSVQGPSDHLHAILDSLVYFGDWDVFCLLFEWKNS